MRITEVAKVEQCAMLKIKVTFYKFKPLQVVPDFIQGFMTQTCFTATDGNRGFYEIRQRLCLLVQLYVKYCDSQLTLYCSLACSAHLLKGLYVLSFCLYIFKEF